MLTSLFPRRELFSPRPGSRHDLNAAAGSGWEHAAGIAGLVLTALASYGVLALELEGQAGQLILPTLRRGRGQATVAGPASAQHENIEHEAGVRQTS